MRKIGLGFASLLLLAGCFETDFNFKTVIRVDGTARREVEIKGRGASRFLPPEGPAWRVKTFQTQGDQPVLEDKRFHIQAEADVQNPNELGGEFRFNISQGLDGLSAQSREEIASELQIPEPLEHEIGTDNRVTFARRRGIFGTLYEYQEVFEVRQLVRILLRDLKKEIVERDPAYAHVSNLDEMALEKLKRDILPMFRFHSELTLPGVIVSSNATRLKRKAAVWDFTGDDFGNDFTRYKLHAISRRSHVGIFFAMAGIVILCAGLLFVRKRRRRS